ncbi:Msp1 protein-like protein [Aphelenchoides fujianensis]|nr:Msp1 protein-like protein [Aphelenchoides fujianensis]
MVLPLLAGAAVIGATSVGVYWVYQRLLLERWTSCLKRLDLRLADEWAAEAPTWREVDVLRAHVRRAVRAGGWAAVVHALRSGVLAPLESPTGRLLRATPAVLLEGPPGCGKSLLLSATTAAFAGNALRVDFRPIERAAEAEATIRALFGVFRKLRPCLVLVDGTETILRPDGPLHDELAAAWPAPTDGITLLVERTDGDEFEGESVDGHFLRLRVEMPSAAERAAILQLAAARLPLFHDVDFALLARLTDGLSGRQLGDLAQAADGFRRRAGRSAVHESDFRLALERRRNSGKQQRSLHELK